MLRKILFIGFIVSHSCITFPQSCAELPSIDPEQYVYFGDLRMPYDESRTLSLSTVLQELDALDPHHTSVFLKQIITLINNGKTTALKYDVRNAIEDACFLLQDNKQKLTQEQIMLFAETLDTYYQHLDTEQLATTV